VDGVREEKNESEERLIKVIEREEKKKLQRE
jgi:hypothetical protein